MERGRYRVECGKPVKCVNYIISIRILMCCPDRPRSPGQGEGKCGRPMPNHYAGGNQHCDQQQCRQTIKRDAEPGCWDGTQEPPVVGMPSPQRYDYQRSNYIERGKTVAGSALCTRRFHSVHPLRCDFLLLCPTFLASCARVPRRIDAVVRPTSLGSRLRSASTWKETLSTVSVSGLSSGGRPLFA